MRVLRLAGLLALVPIAIATAQPHQRPAPRPVPPRLHGDIGRFHQHDWPVWRSGHWVRGPHSGRVGWWWVTGGIWYPYPVPVYPYPDPFQPPPVTVMPSVPPQPATWYFCRSAGRYYPYVATCPEGWVQVPAVPENAPVPALN
jgi:hypothetical protein